MQCFWSAMIFCGTTSTGTGCTDTKHMPPPGCSSVLENAPPWPAFTMSDPYIYKLANPAELLEAF